LDIAFLDRINHALNRANEVALETVVDFIPLCVKRVDHVINKAICNVCAIVNHLVALLLNSVCKIGHSLFNIGRRSIDAVCKTLNDVTANLRKYSRRGVNAESVLETVDKTISETLDAICNGTPCVF
jgi:hypothetical protein